MKNVKGSGNLMLDKILTNEDFEEINDRAFPPEFYIKDYKLVMKCFSAADAYFKDDEAQPENGVSSENKDDPFDGIDDLFNGIDDSSKEIKYEHRNDLRFHYLDKDRYSYYRLFVKDIGIENGKITFFFEDDAPPLIIEDRFLMSTFRTDSEVSFPDKYESFWGKKSILKHHFKNVYPCNTSYFWQNEDASYYTTIITECLHDGVTSFTICEDDMLDIFGKEIEFITFPDGVYNMDGVKVAENDDDFDERYPVVDEHYPDLIDENIVESIDKSSGYTINDDDGIPF